MLYSINKFRSDPILIVKIYAPLHYAKQIHAIDCELIRLTANYDGILYRIDDVSRLAPHHFTYGDAQQWFTGDVREDARWRSNIQHVAVANKGIRRYSKQLAQRGHPVHVPVFGSLYDAITHCHTEIARGIHRD